MERIMLKFGELAHFRLDVENRVVVFVCGHIFYIVPSFTMKLRRVCPFACPNRP